ncbi:sigma-70 family RNA polymerase sigma factor [Rossellomorea vietnamensis]|uniref:Sigma-70 family RNA polymerase sigma factor n=2 Tax=Rossellomorea TaxID=2837508 RepID=A0A5D4KCW3_9BACI|nr:MULTISPECIES: sigma-70 family RNA polymerase sigma factor [Rossellomorea]TYR73983.1 sigma-70 family RNA polymerase sigma factor [Rossellomorea vietnamensis]TYS82862.1 sigma-70 family RNA polymerase sigma factor [Rossellomorea aquimaris]
MEKSKRDSLLEQIMKEYGDELVRLAYSYVKDVDIAKDITQNAFVKCYQKLDSFRGDSKMKTWLYRITINECKDHLKSWNHKKVRVMDYIQENTKSMLPSAESSVFKEAKNQEIKNIVLSLPKKYREVLYLYYYDSLNIEEVAEVTDLGVNTVKTRLRRAKQRLKIKLEEAELYGR